MWELRSHPWGGRWAEYYALQYRQLSFDFGDE